MIYVNGNDLRNKREGLCDPDDVHNVIKRALTRRSRREGFDVLPRAPAQMMKSKHLDSIAYEKRAPLTRRALNQWLCCSMCTMCASEAGESGASSNSSELPK